MSSKRIEQLIDEVYEYIESCKPKGFSGSQVIVPKEELYDLLDEMRLKVPDEIKKCQKMIANRDAIIANAEERAQKIIADAQAQAEQLVNENDIVRRAYLRENEIISAAIEQAEGIRNTVNQDAEQIRIGALSYTNEMLAAVERVMTATYQDTKQKTEALLASLQQNLDIVSANRKELCEDIAPEAAQTVPETAGEESEGYDRAADDEEYNIDSDAFLRNVD